MELSQSIIKHVLEFGLCPKKFKAYYLDCIYEREPTMAMFRGIYFEYRVLGNLPKNRKVPVYPLGKKGKYEIAKSRIDEQVERFASVMEAEGIRIIGGVQQVSWQYSQSVRLTLTLDSILYYKDRLYVGDLKLTQDLTSDFGALSWGNYSQMDKLQAHLYSYVMTQVMGEPVGFLYMVFDYKPSVREYRIFEESPGESDINQMFDRIMEAERKMRWMEQVGYRPQPFEKTCKTCAVVDCVARYREETVPAEEMAPKPEGKTVSVSVEELLTMMKL